jgi:DNA segregation ATPase FtsK/SpoIIIE-like protein
LSRIPPQNQIVRHSVHGLKSLLTVALVYNVPMAREDVLRAILAELRLIRAGVEKINTKAAKVTSEDRDILYPDAERLVIKAGSASTSLLQRVLGIGHARAARLMDMLAEKGVIKPEKGTSIKEVVLTPEAIEVLKKIEAELKKKRPDTKKSSDKK